MLSALKLEAKENRLQLMQVKFAPAELTPAQLIQKKLGELDLRNRLNRALAVRGKKRRPESVLAPHNLVLDFLVAEKRFTDIKLLRTNTLNFRDLCFRMQKRLRAAARSHRAKREAIHC
jgi:hypothetical protein